MLSLQQTKWFIKTYISTYNIAFKHEGSLQLSFLKITDKFTSIRKTVKSIERFKTDSTCGQAKQDYDNGRVLTYDFDEGRLYSYKKKNNGLSNLFKRKCNHRQSLSVSSSEDVVNTHTAVSQLPKKEEGDAAAATSIEQSYSILQDPAEMEEDFNAALVSYYFLNKYAISCPKNC